MNFPMENSDGIDKNSFSFYIHFHHRVTRERRKKRAMKLIAFSISERYMFFFLSTPILKRLFPGKHSI
jgi:hypothetical protein